MLLRGIVIRIARYLFNGDESYGILQDKSILPLPAIAKTFGRELPGNIESFIADINAQEIDEWYSKRESNDYSSASIPIDDAKLLSPIASPPKILCLGLNYTSHVNETKGEMPEQPVVFMKPRTALVGPNDKIIKRRFVRELDYEGELAVVIGKTAKDVTASEALNFVFGYTILNDVSARDFQFKGSQWTIGKGFDTFAPIGPCITTINQMPKTDNLTIKTWINDEMRQNGNTKDMIFSVAQVIHRLSQVMTLEPCDIIATGTPSGVAMAMKPPNWLKDNDKIRIEIEGIGALENTVEEK